MKWLWMAECCARVRVKGGYPGTLLPGPEKPVLIQETFSAVPRRCLSEARVHAVSDSIDQACCAVDLCNCSLVCKLLRAAAAAATQELAFDLSERADRCQQLLEWLMIYGQHVTGVQLQGGSVPLHLPCPQLQQLHLNKCVVQLGESNCSSASSTTALKKLVSHSCSFSHISDESLGMLAALSSLQHLELCCPDCIAWNSTQPVTLRCDVQQLTLLTHLNLAFNNETDQSLLHISTLHGLRELALQGRLDTPEDLLLSPSTFPGTSCLTALTQLQLTGACLDVAVLQPLTRLQQLALTDMSLPAGCRAAAVLAYISRLAMLQTLKYDVRTLVSDTTPAEAYAALTAHSSLKALVFSPPDTGPDKPCPPDLWRVLFPEGRRLMQCTSVKLFFHYEAVTPEHMDFDEVSDLVSCCPGLQELWLPTEPRVQLEPLTQLTALTQLAVFGPPDQRLQRGCLQGLSRLTGLSRLDLYGYGDLQLPRYMPLTQLQQLTRLSLGDVVRDSYNTLYTWSAAKGKPEVWQQLLQAIQGASRDNVDQPDDESSGDESSGDDSSDDYSSDE